MCGPVLAGDNREYGADRRRFDNRRECLLEVDAWALMEATNNPPSFVVFEGAVGVEFVLEDPLAGDDLGISGTRHERPGTIVLKGIKLELHCGTPVGVAEGCTNGRRHR